MIYALDPGPTQSALVILDGSRVVEAHISLNDAMLEFLTGRGETEDVLVVEQVASYGMAVGAEVFETVWWSGRFHQAWHIGPGATAQRLPRLKVKLALCHDSRAKDTNIRQAVIDLYGGPEQTRKGGALAGIKKDLWAALALGLAYQELAKERAA
jgi:hypothetical protein